MNDLSIISSEDLIERYEFLRPLYVRKIKELTKLLGEVSSIHGELVIITDELKKRGEEEYECPEGEELTKTY
jgi:hypothetical protein